MKNSLYFLLILFFSCTETNNKQLTQNLNSNWVFKQENKTKWYPTSIPSCIHSDLLKNKLIKAPYYRTNEKQLQWIDKQNWIYKKEFKIDSHLLKKGKIELSFDGIDTYSTIIFNNQILGSTNNMFRKYVYDISKIAQQKNTLKVILKSPTQKGLALLKAQGYQHPASNDQSKNGEMGSNKVSIHTRKAGYHYGWDWGPRFVTSGIWKNVNLNFYTHSKINTIYYKQNTVNTKLAKIDALSEFTILSKGDYKIEILANNKLLKSRNIKLKEGTNSISTSLEIKNPKLWFPNGIGTPYLYNVEFKLYYQNKVIAIKKNKIGLRDCKLIKEKNKQGESFYFKINGHTVFSKGANYIPNDVFLSDVSSDKYEYIVKSAVEANMNMIRVWGGGIYEKQLFYDLCDQYGLMVWQDFMFACSMYPGNKEFLENVKQEAKQNIIRLRNHPCIVLWCGNNEIEVAWAHYQEKRGWGWKKRFSESQREEIWKAYKDIFLNILPESVKIYSPSTPYWSSSPSTGNIKKAANYSGNSGDTHYWGVWHGKELFKEFESNISRFVSEYGFQSFPIFESVKKYTLPQDWNIESEVMAAHQRSGIGNLRIKEYMNIYYKEPKDFENLLYVGQVLQAEGIKKAIESHKQAAPFCLGTLYWQLNDCWPVASWSSIDYYGKWKATHYFAKKAFQNITISSKLKKGKVELIVCNDSIKDIEAKVFYNLMDFNGKSIFKDSITRVFKTNKPITIKKLTTNKYIHSKLNNYVLVSNIYVNNKLVDNDLCYFKKVKDLNLKKAIINFKFEYQNNRTYITISTNKLVKNLYLHTKNQNPLLKFSDNFFDVLPYTSKTISINEKIEKSDLNYLCINNSY